MSSNPTKEFLVDSDLVLFRHPRFSDWRNMMEKANSLTEEKSFGASQQIHTAEQHMQRMTERLNAIENNIAVYLVVEIRGIVVGSACIWKTSDKPDEGWLEISIRSTIPKTRKKLRGKGIGTKLTLAILHEAKTVLMVKIVKLGVYAVNHRALQIYRKCGFTETSRVRREKNHFGTMRDRIYMQKCLR